ncbi:MAG: mitochondrial fission ELM1 family protein, partial [Synergistaceae bacterium]|nr:mitochondrial fission ELM1 family protein [Synergistaceae bacterium]
MTDDTIERRADGPRRVVVLSDGLRGHVHQSLGVARWIERMCGASVETIDVPRLHGLERLRRLKLDAIRLPRASMEEARAWLASSGLPVDAREDLLDEDTLSISAGSSAAPFCLALAKASGGHCATIMTPSVLGTRPFSFAIVPAHDHPRPASNVLTTLGAPNHIHRPDLRAAAEARFPPPPAKVVALLLGGSD